MAQYVTSTVSVLVETMKREGRMKVRRAWRAINSLDDLGAKPLVGIFWSFLLILCYGSMQ